MKKAQPKNAGEIKRVYRKARTSDIEKWHEARSRENDTMIQSRQIAKSLELDMKIGDVEYQGDCNKAIFYYIADSRVDFRKLIRVLADTFHVRVEMRQIGARQEAGRIGGIGPCGRELCCSTWMKNFQTVSTGAARQQDISPNPQKLAGQCGKLKCCLNYELDAYNEAHKSLPERNVPLETIDGTYYHFKADILSGQITYSTDKRMAANLVTVSAERALEVMEMNRGGEKPETLDNGAQPTEKKVVDLAEQDDLTRFDKSKKRKKRRPRPDNARQTAPEEGQEEGAPQRPAAAMLDVNARPVATTTATASETVTAMTAIATDAMRKPAPIRRKATDAATQRARLRTAIPTILRRHEPYDFSSYSLFWTLRATLHLPLRGAARRFLPRSGTLSAIWRR